MQNILHLPTFHTTYSFSILGIKTITISFLTANVIMYRYKVYLLAMNKSEIELL